MMDYGKRLLRVQPGYNPACGHLPDEIMLSDMTGIGVARSSPAPYIVPDESQVVRQGSPFAILLDRCPVVGSASQHGNVVALPCQFASKIPALA
jgi:hypothetical protein